MNRATGLRLLILVLGCTASRTNFPLPGQAPARRNLSPACQISAAADSAKKDDVIPSRRHHDSRRLDWVKSLVVLLPVAKASGSPFEPPPPGDAQDVPASLRLPRYLQAFLNGAAQESIPPPPHARGSGIRRLP